MTALLLFLGGVVGGVFLGSAYTAYHILSRERAAAASSHSLYALGYRPFPPAPAPQPIETIEGFPRSVAEMQQRLARIRTLHPTLIVLRARPGDPRLAPWVDYIREHAPEIRVLTAPLSP